MPRLRRSIVELVERIVAQPAPSSTEKDDKA
jgi:hypothetical protein